MNTMLSYGEEVRFLRHDNDTYMLRPYGWFGERGVEYAVYKQTKAGFEKVCCVSCQTDDYPEEVWDKVSHEMKFEFQNWQWEEAEAVWEKEHF